MAIFPLYQQTPTHGFRQFFMGTVKKAQGLTPAQGQLCVQRLENLQTLMTSRRAYGVRFEPFEWKI